MSITSRISGIIGGSNSKRVATTDTVVGSTSFGGFTWSNTWGFNGGGWGNTWRNMTVTADTPASPAVDVTPRVNGIASGGITKRVSL